MRRCCERLSASSFRRVFLSHRIEALPLEKAELAIRSAFCALNNPTNGRHVAVLGEILGKEALIRMHRQMRSDAEGRAVLIDKPLIDRHSLDFDNLRSLPDDTLGREYMRFMDAHGYHADGRDPVRFIDNEDLAYVMTRYRQLHDFSHTAWALGTSVEAEVALKCIEMSQTLLPMTVLSTVFGPLSAPLIRIVNHPSSFLRSSDSHEGGIEYQTPRNSQPCDRPAEELPKQKALYPRRVLLSELLPWAIQASLSIRRPMHVVYVEKWLQKPLEDFRRHCGILLPPKSLKEYTG